MFHKFNNIKLITILTLIGIIIYFNKEIRTYIFINNSIKKEINKLENLNKLYKSENDSILFPDNQNLIEKFRRLYNDSKYINTYDLFSEEFQQNHIRINYINFLQTIMKEFGTIDSFKIEAINYSFSENAKYYKSKENYSTTFEHGIGSILVIVNMYDSIDTKINEIGFQIDNPIAKTMFKKQTDNLFQLLENDDYKKLNELTTIEYNLSLTEDNFMNVNSKFFKNKDYKLTHSFIMLKKENNNSEISLVFEKDNKILEVTLEVDTIGNFRINNFKLTE